MLEHVPQWLGAAMRNLRAGADKLTIAQEGLGDNFGSLRLSSPAFGHGGPLPARHSADGEGVSPPLEWDGEPAGTRSLALIVEDADAPSLQPLVHAIVWNIDPALHHLSEGAIRADGPAETGRNSYLMTGWLPPDPPTGHGTHHYAFQIFALSQPPELGANPGRSALVEAISGRVLAAGLLVGTYRRDGAEKTPIDAGATAFA
jgi:Raf kinase inhibitor-like YbhB/YbcL family protein